jgi:putative hemolysin
MMQRSDQTELISEDIQKRCPACEEAIPQLDVKKILKDKLPALNDTAAGVIAWFLRRIVHEEEANSVYRKFGKLQGLDFANALIYDHFNITVDVFGAENLPANSDLIFASNHPIGSIDGIALITVLAKHYKSLKIPVNDMLLNIKNLNEFFIPVNKVKGAGSDQRNMSSLLNEAMGSDAPVLFFPAGQCSRKQPDGTVRDNEWKKTFISKAKEYKRDVVPIYFHGKNSNLFLNLAYYRNKLGIKANIEMILLAHEMFNKKDEKFTIVIGEPIAYSSFDNSKSDREWADVVKKRSYELSGKLGDRV